MQMLRTRAAYTGTKAAEDGRKIHTFKATSEALDRQGEIVTASGWKTANYAANPVVLDAHNYGTIGAILGKCVDVRDTGSGLEADIMFAKTSAGQIAEQLVEDGMLNAVSVGFQSLKRERGAKHGEPLRHTEKDLMEISMVPVPANPEALRVRSIDDEVNAILNHLADALGIQLTKETEALLSDEAAVESAKAGRTHSAATVAKLRETATALETHSKALHEMCDSMDKPDGKSADELTGKVADPPREDTPSEDTDEAAESIKRLMDLAQSIKAATGRKE